MLCGECLFEQLDKQTVCPVVDGVGWRVIQVQRLLLSGHSDEQGHQLVAQQGDIQVAAAELREVGANLLKATRDGIARWRRQADAGWPVVQVQASQVAVGHELAAMRQGARVDEDQLRLQAVALVPLLYLPGSDKHQTARQQAPVHKVYGVRCLALQHQQQHKKIDPLWPLKPAFGRSGAQLFNAHGLYAQGRQCRVVKAHGTQVACALIS